MFLTYIITTYQYAYSKFTVGIVCMQREKYLKQNGTLGYSRKYFITDLIKFITSLTGSKNRIILATNINQHVVEGKLGKKLKRIEIIATFF